MNRCKMIRSVLVFLCDARLLVMAYFRNSTTFVAAPPLKFSHPTILLPFSPIASDLVTFTSGIMNIMS